jgi:hypothetical protein
MKMRKAGLWIAFISGVVALLLVAGIALPVSHVYPNHPLTHLMNSMREIGLKVWKYREDHPATEADTFKGKSIQDLVAMDVISTADADILDKHHGKFFGVDPGLATDRVPMFEVTYPPAAPRLRIVVYSDISVVQDRLP